MKWAMSHGSVTRTFAPPSLGKVQTHTDPTGLIAGQPPTASSTHPRRRHQYRYDQRGCGKWCNRTDDENDRTSEGHAAFVRRRKGLGQFENMYRAQVDVSVSPIPFQCGWSTSENLNSVHSRTQRCSEEAHCALAFPRWMMSRTP